MRIWNRLRVTQRHSQDERNSQTQGCKNNKTYKDYKYGKRDPVGRTVL
jgi:hypothetical protein